MALSRIKTWVAEKLYASDLNAEFNNILNNALSLISPLTGNLNAGGFRITDGGVPTALADFMRATDLIHQTPTFYTSAGTSTAYTLTPNPAITAYAAGQTFWVKFDEANGEDPTINISALGAKNITYKDGTNIATDTIAANEIYPIVYDGTVFRLPFNITCQKLYDSAVSAVASVELTRASWYDGTFKQLHIYLSNFTVSTATSNILGRVSNDGGSSWISSAGAYGRAILGAQGNGGAASATIDTATSMTLANDITTTASENNILVMKLLVPPNVSGYHVIETLIHYFRHNGGANVFNISNGTFQHRNGASVINGIQLSVSAGTFSAESLRVYGFR